MQYNMGNHANSIRIDGIWDILVVGADGRVRDAREAVKNLIVDAGKVHLVDFLVDFAGADPAIGAGYGMSYLAIGTGAVAAAAGNTALGTEVGTRVNGTKSEQSGGSILNVYQVVGTFAANNPGTTQAITEAGLFSASTVGTMFNRVVFSAINKETADSLQLTVKVTFG